MAFKSEAQRKHFQEKLKAGTISQKTFDEWQANTPPHKLPDRLGSPKRSGPATDLREITKIKKVKKI